MSNTVKYLLIAAAVVVAIFLVRKFTPVSAVKKTGKAAKINPVETETTNDDSDAEKLEAAANAAEAARLKAKVDAINAQLKKDADIARARFCKLFPKSLGCK